VGAAEIVRESGAGLVVAGEPEPLGSAIGRLTADLNLARSMGEAGRRHAARFTWDHVAVQMEDLYNSLKLSVHAFGAPAPANDLQEATPLSKSKGHRFRRGSFFGPHLHL
jgi:hypothetical protein